MKYALWVRDEAAAEIKEARDWHERQRKGQGAEIRKRIKEVLARLRQFPLMGTEVAPGVRRLVVPGSPYSVYYQLEESTIVVLSVFHGRRDPKEWQSRIE